MKNRKASKQQISEDRNALYHKVIIRNIELGKKNTELARTAEYWQIGYIILLDKYVNYVNRRRWWQFWKWFR